MKHADFPVDILDAGGEITGQKPRRELDKRHDIYHSVHVILVNEAGAVAISVIPQREELPNIYAGLLGTTMATVCRAGESGTQAAQRGLAVELLMEDPELVPVFEGMVTLSDKRRTKLSAFLVRADRPELYRDADIGELLLMEPDSVEVTLTMHPDRIAPTLKAIWPACRDNPLIKGKS